MCKTGNQMLFRGLQDWDGATLPKQVVKSFDKKFSSDHTKKTNYDTSRIMDFFWDIMILTYFVWT